MKRVLITGGAGFIGSALCNHFTKAGHEVFVVDDLSFGSRSFIDIDDQHFYKSDILQAEELDRIVTVINPHWLVHLAAVHFIPWCNEHPEEATKINIEGTTNVFNAARKATALEKILFASTAAVYPIYEDAITEANATGPLDVYGRSKLAGEKLCDQFYLDTNVPTIICRFFNAFGPNETNPHLIPEIQRQVNSGKRTIQLGNLTPKRDFIHTYDMARAVDLLLQRVDDKDTFNLGRGIEYSVLEVVEAFSRQLGSEIKVEVDPQRVRRVERNHLLADVSKLTARTGWKPQWDLDAGIKTLLNNEGR